MRKDFIPLQLIQIVFKLLALGDENYFEFYKKVLVRYAQNVSF